MLLTQRFLPRAGSALWYSTLDSAVKCLDLRSMEIVHDFSAAPSTGFTTSMCIMGEDNAVLVGSSKGCFSLWDVRYHLNSFQWKSPYSGPVSYLGPYAQHANSPKVVSYTAFPLDDVSVWDVREQTRTQCWYQWSYEFSPRGYISSPQLCKVQTRIITTKPNFFFGESHGHCR